MAYVLTPDYKLSVAPYSKLICYNCKYFEHKHMVHNLYFFTARFINMIGQNVIIVGTSIDPFFHQPLWYRKKIKDKEVWCYNPDHMKDIHNNLRLLKLRKLAGKEKRINILKKIPKWMRESVANRDLAVSTIETWFREGVGSRISDQGNKPTRKGKIINTHMIGY